MKRIIKVLYGRRVQIVEVPQKMGLLSFLSGKMSCYESENQNVRAKGELFHFIAILVPRRGAKREIWKYPLFVCACCERDNLKNKLSYQLPFWCVCVCIYTKKDSFQYF